MRAVPTALPVVIHLSAFRAFYASQRTVEAFPTQLKPVARFMGTFVNRILTSGAAMVIALIAVLSCSDSSTGLDPFNTDSLSVDASRAVASIEVHLASSSIKAGETTQASVTMKDRRGVAIDRPVQWSSSDTTIATVSDSGLVRGVAPGSVNIVARNKTVTGSARLTVTASDPTTIPVASVAVVLASSTLNPGQTTQATVKTLDANGNVLSGRAIAWTTNNSLVATVSSAGVVTAVASGNA
ncbi:MAG TPA: Ig-like domain-containing protein, partial [Gemmatimonadaceae bacterium]